MYILGKKEALQCICSSIVLYIGPCPQGNTTSKIPDLGGTFRLTYLGVIIMVQGDPVIATGVFQNLAWIHMSEVHSL